MPPVQWPSSRDYVEAVQNPRTCFFDPELQTTICAVDRLGMPFVTSGQFAYVFKLNSTSGGGAQAVRCFRTELGDREHRYRKISEHLDKVSAPYFPNFEYDSQGIKIAGRKLPILTMEWIEGHPLDVYLQKILQHSNVIKSLADFWLRALHMMQEAGMAHGDLQHGNIIVDPSNSFRLVDLDGMYVPEMVGLKAAELGHRHYQHPKRALEHFTQKLDNFSGMVIYISLLAIANDTSLWEKYHDDNNLLFKQPDFENPKASPLFQALKKNSETKSLTEILEKACYEAPLQCPSVLEFVKVSQTKLPNWMLNTPTITVDQSNREAKPGTSTVSSIPQSFTTSATPSNSPWWQSAHSTVTNPSGGASAAPSPAQAAVQNTIFNVHVKRFALNYAYIAVFFVWLWHPILKSILLGMGATAGDLFIWEALAFVGASLYAGHRRAKKLGLLNTGPGLRPLHIPVVNVPVQPITPAVSSSRTSSYSPKPAAPVYQPTTAKGAYVASRIRAVFHKSSCSWAYKISYRNRIQFNSAAEAQGRGFKPCGVCNP